MSGLLSDIERKRASGSTAAEVRAGSRKLIEFSFFFFSMGKGKTYLKNWFSLKNILKGIYSNK